MYQITLKALASGQTHTLPVSHEQMSMTLLDFLRMHDFPIASSCSGKVVCRKCVVNGDMLSCQWKVEYFVTNQIAVEIGYL